MKRHKPMLDEGRCCWICGRPGGMGFTTALRQAGYEVPLHGVIAYAHSGCMQRAANRAAKFERRKSGAAVMELNLQKIDFSQLAYRGYLIRTNALEHKMWIEKNGVFVVLLPGDKSWAHARKVVDDLITEQLKRQLI